MNVIQNYLVTIMRGDFSLYEVRIFCKIVEHANKLLKGQRISSLLGKSISVDGITAYMSIPIKEILSDGSKDYAKVYKAAEKLVDKKIEYYDVVHDAWKATAAIGKDGKTHITTHLIKELRWNGHDGMIHFEISVWLLQYILDFVNGNFTMYDLQSALSLPSAYAVRLYWLTCSMSRPVTYPVEMLRQMLQVGNKYQSNKDFIRRCIIPPMRILEERGLNGFKYKVIHKNPDSKTSKIDKIQLIPIKRQKQSPQQLTAQASISAWCPLQLRQYLMQQCMFEKPEIEANKNVMFEFSKVPGWQKKIVEIVNRQRGKRAGKGYIINSMKREIIAHRKAKPSTTAN